MPKTFKIKPNRQFFAKSSLTFSVLSLTERNAAFAKERQWPFADYWQPELKNRYFCPPLARSRGLNFTESSSLNRRCRRCVVRLIHVPNNLLEIYVFSSTQSLPVKECLFIEGKCGGECILA